jgi:DNA-binding response OmpR family regulator
MIADSTKKILVLSDNDKLSRAIEVLLVSRDWAVETVASNPPKQPGNQDRISNLRLIIVAMSSPASEPVVALARASLAAQIGQVPLLIISDKPFNSNSNDLIVHLDFPFVIDELYHKVEAILHRERQIN